MWGKLWNRIKPVDFDSLERQLAEARQALWKHDFASAEAGFIELASDVSQLGGESPRVQSLQRMASLGQWAVKYLQAPASHPDDRERLSGEQYSPEEVEFLANAYSMTGDTSDEALGVYGAFIQNHPADKAIAGIVLMLVETASPSLSALALVEKVGSVLADDAHVTGIICRWAVTLHCPERAVAWADRAVRQHPNHLEANRFLGLHAELRQAWPEAAGYYRSTGDWLRCMVVSCHADDLPGAEQAYGRVPNDQHTGPTYLYYSGWLHFRRGRLPLALAIWTVLGRNNATPGLVQTIATVAKHYLGERLASGDIALSDVALAEQTGVYGSRVLLSYALFQLYKQRDQAGIVELLQVGVAHFPEDQYLAQLSDALRLIDREEGDAQTRGTPYPESLNPPKGLAHWFAGLWFLSLDAQVAARELAQALKTPEALRPIRPTLLGAAAWAATARADQQDATLKSWAEAYVQELTAAKSTDPAGAATLVTSYVAWSVAMNAGDSLLGLANPGLIVTNPYWANVNAARYAARKDWVAAVRALQNLQTMSGEAMLESVLLMALQQAVQSTSWSQASDWAISLLELESEERVVRELSRRALGSLLSQLWSSESYNAVLDVLRYSLDHNSHYDAALHHRLAIAYTQQGLASTAGGIWLKAIGHWAVTLTDDAYWSAWRTARELVFESRISEERMTEIRQKTIPAVILSHMDVLASDKTGDELLTLKKCRAQLVSEPDAASAVRYALKQLVRQSIALPDAVARLISPALIGAYGNEAAGVEFVRLVESHKLSPHETETISQSFSRLANVHALVRAGDFESAYQIVNGLAKQPRLPNTDRPEVTRQKAAVTRLLLQSQLDAGRWQEAIGVASDELSADPANADLETFLVKAVVGAAGQELQQEKNQAAVNALRSRRAQLQRRYTELDAMLGEALARWGIEAIDNAPDTALTRFAEAIKMSPENAQARKGAAHIYRQRAFQKAQRNLFLDAEKDAHSALGFDDSTDTRELLGLICGSQAQECAQRNDWPSAVKYAAKAVEYGNNKAAMQLYIRVCVGQVGDLANRQQFATAIQLATNLGQLNVDWNDLDLDIDLNKILSELHNNYGVLFSRSGNYAEARRQYSMALRYDPSNYTARRNLR